MITLEQGHKRRILLLMMAMMLLGVSSIDIYIASLPQMVIDFHSTPAIINLTISSFTFGIAFMVLFTGEISNRFGRSKVLSSGLGVFAVTSILIALMPSINGIIFLRVIQALGCSTILIVPRLILKDCMNEREQITANGMLLTALIISPAIAPIVGAYLAKYLGWRSCFVFIGLCSGLLCYLSIKIIPETNLNQLKSFASPVHYLKVYYTLLTDRVFIALTAIYASAVGAYFVFIGISSYLYINYWHLTPLVYSYLFICLSIAYLIGNQVMRSLNRRKVSPNKIIAVGVYSTLLGMLIIIIAALISHGVLLMILVTFGVLFMRAANALINPPTQIRIMSQFDPYSAQALGLNMCIGFAATSLATYWVTVIGFNPFLSFILLASVMVIICVFFFRYNVKHL